MKFCENCGAKLEDDALFCEECGTACEQVVSPQPAIEVPKQEPITAQEPVTNQTLVSNQATVVNQIPTPTQESTKPGINPNIIAVGVIVIIVLVLAIVLASVIGKNKKGNTSTNTSVAKEASLETSTSQLVENKTSQESDLTSEKAQLADEVQPIEEVKTTEEIQPTEEIPKDGPSQSETSDNAQGTLLEQIKTQPVYSATAKDNISLGKYTYQDEYYYLETTIDSIEGNNITLTLYKENLISQKAAYFKVTAELSESSMKYPQCPYSIRGVVDDSRLTTIEYSFDFSPNMRFLYYSADAIGGEEDYIDSSYECLMFYEEKKLYYDSAVTPQVPDGTYNISYWARSIESGYFYFEGQLISQVDYKESPIGFYALGLSPDVKAIPG